MLILIIRMPGRRRHVQKKCLCGADVLERRRNSCGHLDSRKLVVLAGEVLFIPGLGPHYYPGIASDTGEQAPTFEMQVRTLDFAGGHDCQIDLLWITLWRDYIVVDIENGYQPTVGLVITIPGHDFWMTLNHKRHQTV